MRAFPVRWCVMKHLQTPIDGNMVVPSSVVGIMATWSEGKNAWVIGWMKPSWVVWMAETGITSFLLLLPWSISSQCHRHSATQSTDATTRNVVNLQVVNDSASWKRRRITSCVPRITTANKNDSRSCEKRPCSETLMNSTLRWSIPGQR